MTDSIPQRPASAFLVGALGLIAGIVLTAFGAAVALAVAVGSNTSFSVPTIIHATSDSGGFVLETGPGIVVVPLLTACGALIIAAFHRRRLVRR